MYLTFAWRYFKAKKSTNAINIIAWITVGAIALATACQILVLSVFNGFEGLVKSLYGAFYTDLKVIPARGKTFLLTPEQISRLKGTAGVEGFSMIAEEKALLQNKEQEDMQTTVYLKGVDENYSHVTNVAAKTIQGKFETGTAETPSLVVGYGIQNAVAVNVGEGLDASTLTIILPKKGKVNVSDPMGSLSEGNAVASGVFSIQQEFDNKYAITNIAFVKQQMGFGADEYSACEIKLKPAVEIATVQQQLQRILGTDYTVQTKFQQNQSLYSTMRMEKWFIYAVFTLILVVSAFTMISALTMLVLEKQKDIGILQSMGASRAIILKIFLSEGLLLGAIGVASGILFALLVCLLQDRFHLLKLKGGSFLIDYFPVKLDISDFIMVASTAAAIAFIASWFPARKASRQEIELR